MRKIYTLLVLICTLFYLQINAQTSKTLKSTEDIIRCYSYEHELEMRSKYPALGTIDQFEARIAPFVEATKQAILNGDQRAVTTIPVVFHVIHDNDAIGATPNVSSARINAQLEQLNNDFRKVAGTSGNNTDPRGADSEVNFCAAIIGPSGQILTEPGINRINRSSAGFIAPPHSPSYINNTIKPSTIWDADKYMNVWIVELTGSTLGYAQFPFNSGLPGLNPIGTTITDGVVVLYSSVGSTDLIFPGGAPYNKGRTLTHEVGHWLGLRHIWGDEFCGDDFCGDTPTQANPSSGNCPNSTTCDGNTDMTRNYMDYSNDVCMNIFTFDQKARMQTVLSLSRPNLGTQALTACNANALVANFSADVTSGCPGLEVNFTNNSSGNITSYSWDFGNGNTSAAENPPAQIYPNAGTYTVTLTVGDGSMTNSVSETITVTDGGTFNHLNGGSLVIIPGGETGFISGNNSFLDQAKAEYFEEGAAGATLGDVDFFFERVVTNASTVRFRVWDGVLGTPTTVLATQDIPTGSISTTGATTIDFGGISLNGPFFVGFELTNATGEDIVLFTNSDGETTPSTAWEQWSNGVWFPFNDNTGSGTTWEVDVALAIFATIECPTIGTPPVADFNASSTAICLGTNIQFTDASSEEPTSWSWDFGDGGTSSAQNPSYLFSSSGIYTVELTVANAAGSDAITSIISVSEAPVPTITESNGLLTANVAGTVSYQWFVDGNAINGATQSTFSPAVSGDYSVTIGDENGCSASSNTINVTISKAIDLVLDNAISIYPNPVNNYLSIDFGSVNIRNLSYSIVDVAGKALQNTVVTQNVETIDFTRFAAGVYIVQIQSDTGFTFRKVVKK